MAKAKLRILMVAPTPYFADRGCHVRIFEEARSLRSLGHDIRIVTYHIGRDMPGIPVIRIPSIPWYKKLQAGPSWHKLYLDALLIYKAAAVALTFKPHVIHAHLHEGAFIGSLVKRICRAPLVFDYQGSLSGECIDHGFFEADSLVARIFRSVEGMINGFADMIVTSSTSGFHELKENWGVVPERLVSVIDGVDSDFFRSYPQAEMRERLALPLDMPIIAYLGVLSSYQGTDLLLDCIAQLKAAGVRAHFLIMGFPCERYQAEAQKLDIADMITFTGKVDYREAPFFLSAADIAVSPKLSLTEANGKLFNYMACGLPTVVFDTPVNREVLGDTGIYARFGEAGDFAQRIREILSDKEAQRDYSEKVHQKAVREHGWQARGGVLEKLYYDILQKKQH